MNALERDAHIRQTEAFIAMDSSKISFTRKAEEDDGQGGRIEGEPVILGPQVVRVVGQRNNSPSVTVDGLQVKIDKSIIGMPVLDVEIGDTFEYASRTFEVKVVQRDPVWRVEAGAIEVKT